MEKSINHDEKDKDGANILLELFQSSLQSGDLVSNSDEIASHDETKDPSELKDTSSVPNLTEESTESDKESSESDEESRESDEESNEIDESDQVAPNATKEPSIAQNQTDESDAKGENQVAATATKEASIAQNQTDESDAKGENQVPPNATKEPSISQNQNQTDESDAKGENQVALTATKQPSIAQRLHVTDVNFSLPARSQDDEGASLNSQLTQDESWVFRCNATQCNSNLVSHDHEPLAWMMEPATRLQKPTSDCNREDEKKKLPEIVIVPDFPHDFKFSFPSQYSREKLADIDKGVETSAYPFFTESLKSRKHYKGNRNGSVQHPFTVDIEKETIEDLRISVGLSFRRLQPQQIKRETTDKLLDFYLLWIQRGCQLPKDFCILPIAFYSKMEQYFQDKKRLRNLSPCGANHILRNHFYSSYDGITCPTPWESNCVCIPFAEERKEYVFYSCVFFFDVKQEAPVAVVFNGTQRDSHDNDEIEGTFTELLSLFQGGKKKSPRFYFVGKLCNQATRCHGGKSESLLIDYVFALPIKDVFVDDIYSSSFRIMMTIYAVLREDQGDYLRRLSESKTMEDKLFDIEEELCVEEREVLYFQNYLLSVLCSVGKCPVDEVSSITSRMKNSASKKSASITGKRSVVKSTSVLKAPSAFKATSTQKRKTSKAASVPKAKMSKARSTPKPKTSKATSASKPKTSKATSASKPKTSKATSASKPKTTKATSAPKPKTSKATRASKATSAPKARAKPSRTTKNNANTATSGSTARKSMKRNEPSQSTIGESTAKSTLNRQSDFLPFFPSTDDESQLSSKKPVGGKGIGSRARKMRRAGSKDQISNPPRSARKATKKNVTARTERGGAPRKRKGGPQEGSKQASKKGRRLVSQPPTSILQMKDEAARRIGKSAVRKVQCFIQATTPIDPTKRLRFPKLENFLICRDEVVRKPHKVRDTLFFREKPQLTIMSPPHITKEGFIVRLKEILRELEGNSRDTNISFTSCENEVWESIFGSNDMSDTTRNIQSGTDGEDEASGEGGSDEEGSRNSNSGRDDSTYEEEEEFDSS